MILQDHVSHLYKFSISLWNFNDHSGQSSTTETTFNHGTWKSNQ